jgi:hypothetical protein
MNEIFAIDPNAPRDIKDIKAMFENFGLTNGRFIANYPNDWQQMLTANMNRLEGLDRSRFIRLLDLHRDTLLGISGDYRRGKTWLDNLSDNNLKRIGIDKILADDPNPLGLETLNDFLWNQDVVNMSRGAHIPMTLDSYRHAIAPIFEHQTEIHIVDPYFHLRTDRGDIHRAKISLLREILKLAEKSSRCDFLILHFKKIIGISREAQEEFIESDLIEIIKDCSINRLSVNFVVWDEMFHGRYIFGIKGGLQFDYGFEIIRDKTNHVHWLSKSELEPIIKRYL